jgi:hypothetical protein
MLARQARDLEVRGLNRGPGSNFSLELQSCSCCQYGKSKTASSVLSESDCEKSVVELLLSGVSNTRNGINSASLVVDNG